jgi:hypothetical protein
MTTSALPGGLSSHPEEVRRVAAEGRHLFFIADGGRRQDGVHRMLLPGIGMIAAERDLACADLCRKLAERLGGEYQRARNKAASDIRPASFSA